jgi:hypothetical protein
MAILIRAMLVTFCWQRLHTYEYPNVRSTRPKTSAGGSKTYLAQYTFHGQKRRFGDPGRARTLDLPFEGESRRTSQIKRGKTVLASLGLSAHGLSARRERPNALRSCDDPRLHRRYARGVRSADGQPQFTLGVESGPNSAGGEAQPPTLSSSQPQPQRRRHPAFGRKR